MVKVVIEKVVWVKGHRKTCYAKKTQKIEFTAKFSAYFNWLSFRTTPCPEKGSTLFSTLTLASLGQFL